MQIPNSQKTILDGGMKILTENIPSVRSVALGIVVGAGSADEIEKEEGLTHFIEHMAFKGTKRRSAFDIASELDAVGGRLNAYTSKEYTLYYASVLEKHIDIAFDVLSDIFLNPSLKEEDIEMEKGVILEEINMYEDSPDELVHDLFAEKILNGHPFGKPTLGTKDSVGSFKKESFLKYRERLYTPDNVIISAAGNVSHEDVVGFSKKIFGSFPGTKNKKDLGIPKISNGIKIRNKQTEQTHLCLGTKGLSQVDEERYVLSVLDTILGGSMSSRLFQEVREKRGLAYSIYSNAHPFSDFGIFYVYAGCDKKNLENVVTLILEQFRQFKKEGITKEELQRGKEHLKGGLVLGLESTSSRMSYLAKSEFYYNKTVLIDEIFDEIDKVSLDDIIKTSEELFRNEYLTLTVIGDIDSNPFKTLEC